MKLSDNLKRIRKDNNLSQEQLAEKLGVSRQAVSKWESGQSYPEMDKVLLICKLFNYNIDELMNENVKEVEETKQSKININKYIDDFFGFITKTVDVFTSMRFRDRIKCLIEIFLMCIFLVLIYVILSSIGGSIFANTFGMLPNNIYFIIINILESICTILFLIISVTVLLHIFKIRYLDYYEIIKEYSEEENIQAENNNNNQTEKQEKYDEKRKIFIEKKKEKIIIRDPNHSQSKFLNGLFRILLSFIKFMAICIAVFFVFTFIGLFCLLVLSFMFVKTGLVFWGTLFGIISGIIVNFIILELFYNFIISKKSKRTRMAISFIVALILSGISVGIILIGITQFNYISESNIKNEIEEVYEYEMSENLSITTWNCPVEYIEVDSNKVKIVVQHSKYLKTYINEYEQTIQVYCNSDGVKTMEELRDIIKDINNKEIVEYPNPKMYVYASKENIEKMRQNEITKYKLSIEVELEKAYKKNEQLENKIFELEDKVQEKEKIIETLELEIQDLKTEMKSISSQMKAVEYTE